MRVEHGCWSASRIQASIPARPWFPLSSRLAARRIDIGPADFPGEIWNYFAAGSPRDHHMHDGRAQFLRTPIRRKLVSHLDRSLVLAGLTDSLQRIPERWRIRSSFAPIHHSAAPDLWSRAAPSTVLKYTPREMLVRSAHSKQKARRSGLLFTVGLWSQRDRRTRFFPAAHRFTEADSDLRSGTNNYLVHIDISRLLDRERNGAGNRHRRNRPSCSSGR